MGRRRCEVNFAAVLKAPGVGTELETFGEQNPLRLWFEGAIGGFWRVLACHVLVMGTTTMTLREPSGSMIP